MGTICIIAEKPSVARELAAIVGADRKGNGYIEGNGYIVTWAIGHLVTLAMPEAYGHGKSGRDTLPLLPDPFLLVVRQVRDGKEYKDDPAAVRQLSAIRNCLNRSEAIIVATDAGREGELIFRYVYSYLNCTKPFKRLWISSLTDKAIREGLSSLRPGCEFDSLYRAGKARSEADWLVGINASRALSISAGRTGYSLGRVQTPTLAIICRRYLENRDFRSVPYWKLEAVTEKDGMKLKAVSVTSYDNRDEALSAVEAILQYGNATGGKGLLSVSRVERKAVRSEPPFLYDLTTLQKEANRKHGFSADTTLSIAQTLYEKKLTTYPRTGSRYISDDVFEEIPDLIRFAGDKFGYKEIADNLLSGNLNRHSVDTSKVTDHHALLITGNTPEGLDADEDKIYRMILSRMLEAFSEPSLKDTVQALSESAGIGFTLKAEAVTSKGWRAVLDEKDENEGSLTGMLPGFQEGEQLAISGLYATGHRTKPMPLFTEATLLGAMENAGKNVEDSEVREAMSGCGIGTPATRASIIETLIIREYIRRDKKTLVPTDKGLAVYEAVKDKQIANAEMTGQWELALSRIEKGELDAETFSKNMREYTGKICGEMLQCGISSAEGQDLLTCPVCRKDTVRTYPKVAKCTDKNCGFKVFREICGKTLSDKDIRSLLSKGRTPVLKGLAGKSGRKFNAAIVLREDGSAAFEFSSQSGNRR